MNVPTATRLVLAVSALAASLTFILDPCPPESDGAVQPLPSEAKGQAVPEILALRIGAKNHIADEVIAGRLSLVQAAALFGALNPIPPQCEMASWSFCFPAATEEELLCRQVLHWVGWALAEEQDRREATLARLEAELMEELGTGRTVRLPDPLTLVPVQKLLQQAREELQRRCLSKGGEEWRMLPRKDDSCDRDGCSREEDS